MSVYTGDDWFIDRRRDTDVNVIKILAMEGGEAVEVAQIYTEGELEPVDHRNAKLIAAAPFMLKAIINAGELLSKQNLNNKSIDDALGILATALNRASP